MSEQIEKKDLSTVILELLDENIKTGPVDEIFDVLYKCIYQTAQQLIDSGLEWFSKDRVVLHIDQYNRDLIRDIENTTKYKVPQIPICVIKECGKEGKYRLIHSDDMHRKTVYGTYHGWVCMDHTIELEQNNYPHLYGDGWNMTIGPGPMNCMPCVACDRGNPCGYCSYKQIPNDNDDIVKWNYGR